MDNPIPDRGKVKQIETFREPSLHWTLTPTDGIHYALSGGMINQSMTLSQEANTTFGFLRLMVDVTLFEEDHVSLSLRTASETIKLVKTKDSVLFMIDNKVVKEVEHQANAFTFQLVLNDERVGCFVIGQRIITLANRQPIASFLQQPFDFQIHTSINHSSKVMIKELVYEYVHE